MSRVKKRGGALALILTTLFAFSRQTPANVGAARLTPTDEASPLEFPSVASGASVSAVVASSSPSPDFNDTIETLRQIFRATAKHMGAHGAKFDPLKLKSHVVPFDDTFIRGNLTFNGQRLAHLADFTPSAVMIDWESSYLWSRLRIDTVEITSVFHIDGSFDDDMPGRRIEWTNGLRRWLTVAEELENNIEILGFSTMKYSGVLIDINAHLTHDKDGFLHVSQMWSTFVYSSSDCSVNSVFPSDWVRHFVCSFNEFDAHEGEMKRDFNGYVIRDLNQQLRDRKVTAVEYPTGNDE